LDVKAIVAVRVTASGVLIVRTRSTASAMDSKLFRSGAYSMEPADVSTTRRVLRSNSLCPIVSSSSRIWWLIAVGVTASSSAARLKLRWRAAASKARRVASGGSFLIGLFIDESCSSDD
jgi:hypothetical protein